MSSPPLCHEFGPDRHRCEAPVSLVIPVYNEAAHIDATLTHLFGLPSPCPLEVVVVDGHPTGNTIHQVHHSNVKTLTGPKGRGRQMNQGARICTGKVLVFLHADTRLPPLGIYDIQAALANPAVAGGAFTLGIDSPRAVFRLIEAVAAIRNRLTGLPYGDQAHFVRRRVFHRLGGYAEIPIMEDVDFMRRLKRAGGKIILLPSRVGTSPRRWHSEGVVYCTLRNWALMLLYVCGVSPVKLARYYRTRTTLGR